MFTGLVAERGRVLSDPEPSPAGGRLLRLGFGRRIADRLAIGASLAVDGVCLTVTETIEGFGAVLEMGDETLRRTTLGELAAGDEVNLEPALRAGDPLGGHLVQGHVEGTLAVLARDDRADHRVLSFELPAPFARYVVEKGSVTLDGVSLTVAELVDESDGSDASGGGSFAVWLVPHTLEVTTLGSLEPGGRVNFEPDVLAKYVERLLAPRLEGSG